MARSKAGHCRLSATIVWSLLVVSACTSVREDRPGDRTAADSFPEHVQGHGLVLAQSLLRTSPLFHDEQRLIVNQSGYKAGPVGRIAVVYDLSQNLDYTQSGGLGVAFVHLDQQSQSTTPFVNQGYSCLVLHEENSAWKWQLIHMSSVETDNDAHNTCAATKGVNGNWNPAYTITDPSGGEPSPVARWDWDPKSGKPYLGIRCGKAWCEIGQDGLKSSGGDYLKGRFDEQFITVETVAGSDAVPILARIERTGNTPQPNDYVHAATITLTVRNYTNSMAISAHLNDQRFEAALNNVAKNWNAPAKWLQVDAPNVQIAYCIRLASNGDHRMKYAPLSASGNPCSNANHKELRLEFKAHPSEIEQARQVHTLTNLESVRMRMRMPTGVPLTTRWGETSNIGLQGWIECGGCCKPVALIQ